MDPTLPISIHTLDVLVNNAGVEAHGSIEELPTEAFIATMNTNYFGAVRCIKAVLPGMRTAKKGCIINISSVAGRIASSPLGPYNASKFALEAIMAHAIEDPPPSAYPHTRRFAGLFRAALERHVPPETTAAARGRCGTPRVRMRPRSLRGARRCRTSSGWIGTHRKTKPGTTPFSRPSG